MPTTVTATGRRSRAPLGLALAGLAALLLVVLAVGWFGSRAGYVRAEQVDHPVPLALAAGTAATLAAVVLLAGSP